MGDVWGALREFWVCLSYVFPLFLCIFYRKISKVHIFHTGHFLHVHEVVSCIYILLIFYATFPSNKENEHVLDLLLLKRMQLDIYNLCDLIFRELSRSSSMVFDVPQFYLVPIHVQTLCFTLAVCICNTQNCACDTIEGCLVCIAMLGLFKYYFFYDFSLFHHHTIVLSCLLLYYLLQNNH